MTTKPRATRTFPPLPDPPEREPEEMTSFDHLTKNGSVHHLAQHLGKPDTTIVASERYIIREPDAPATDWVFLDLLTAVNADLAARLTKHNLTDAGTTSLNVHSPFTLPVDGSNCEWLSLLILL